MSKKENLGTGKRTTSRKTEDMRYKVSSTFSLSLCPPEHGHARKHTHSRPGLQTAMYLKLCIFAIDTGPVMIFPVIKSILGLCDACSKL